MDRNNYKAFLNFLKSAKTNFVKQILDIKDPVLLISHYDADGITSVSLISLLLKKYNVPFHIKILEQIDEASISKISKFAYENIIFTDLGSGEYNILHTYLKKKNLFIIDHHQPDERDRRDNVLEINPYFHGINGSSETSASTLAYLLVREIDSEMIVFSPLAIIGALGDRQDVGFRFTLTGLNGLVVDEAEKYGLIRKEIGLRLAGSKNRPIIKAIEYTFDPYIPGLSGEEEACLMFLKNMGIDPSKDGKLRYLKDMSKDEIKKLATALVKYMLDMGIPSREAERIFGVNYYVQRESPKSPLYDAREYAQILNSCSRLGRSDIAIALCIGFKGKILDNALNLAIEYRRLLAKLLKVAHGKDRKKIFGKTAIVVDLSDLADNKVTGALASILSSIWNLETYVVLVLGKGGNEDKIKVSARLTKRASKAFQEINIGLLLREASKKTNGVGGGHLKAGGALIPRHQIDSFIDLFVSLVNTHGFKR
ncbi:MAG: hypothetical protein DRJ44_04910 [Thermoprotei archaeon]|nr:MAG: hypothetical protein DRJ44_04910 [Thermoprotei archaeon]